jgi:hypothetical protein
VGKRARKRRSRQATQAITNDYADSDGNVLTLRERLSEGTVRKVADLDARPAASPDDRWQRRQELLFERLAVRWTIAGLPIDDQKQLLARYRMASADERRWVRSTIDAHLARHQPDLAGD